MSNETTSHEKSDAAGNGVRAVVSVIDRVELDSPLVEMRTLNQFNKVICAAGKPIAKSGFDAKFDRLEQEFEVKIVDKYLSRYRAVRFYDEWEASPFCAPNKVGEVCIVFISGKNPYGYYFHRPAARVFYKEIRVDTTSVSADGLFIPIPHRDTFPEDTTIPNKADSELNGSNHCGGENHNKYAFKNFGEHNPTVIRRYGFWQRLKACFGL